MLAAMKENGLVRGSPDARRRTTGVRRTASLGMLAAVLLLGAGLPTATAYAADPSKTERPACGKVGTWLDPATGKTMPADGLLSSLTERQIVLLGEVHDNAEHHRWQLHMLAALHGRRPELVIGFEMFPRRVQPVLDKWVRGELDVEAFLRASEWREVWGFDPALYLPLFHFARQNRIPIIALNIDRQLISRVGEGGWAAIPPDERAGLSDPAPPSEGYREFLARIFAVKLARRGDTEAGEAHGAETTADAQPGEPDLAAILNRDDFARFVQAQQTWDRAMAEALADAHRAHPGALVVGIMGRGHIEHGYGVPYQLADLDIPDVFVLLPVEAGATCGDLPADVANAVFVVEPVAGIETPQHKARLGVMIETADDGVRILRVVDGSVAAAMALAPGDIVIAAAGFTVGSVSDLIEIVRRQAPGTWLPLTIRRNGENVDVVAKFPTEFKRFE